MFFSHSPWSLETTRWWSDNVAFSLHFLPLCLIRAERKTQEGIFFFIEWQCWLFFRIQSKLTNPQFALLSENFCNLIWSKNVAHQREIAYQSLFACESTTLPVIAGVVSVRKRPDNSDSSKDVFDRRTSTGSRLFAFWASGFAQIFGQIVYTIVKTLSNIFTVKAFKKGKGLNTVYVRRSKTPLLKPTPFLITSSETRYRSVYWNEQIQQELTRPFSY